MRNKKLFNSDCRRIASLILVLLFCVAVSAQQSFSLPCRKYPAPVPFKCDYSVDEYWHVTSVKCLGPVKGGYKFRISGRANKSHRSERINLYYLRSERSVTVAGTYFFPAIGQGKIFSFDIVSAFRGRTPARFYGFLFINRPLQGPPQRNQEVEQEAAEEEQATAEEEPAQENVAPQPALSPEEESKIYDMVEVMPSFPGGQAALLEYISKNLKYPVVAEENGKQGRVIVTFVVERNGSITDVKVSKSVDPSLDKEAVRVVRAMPHWIPGKKSGSAVRVKFTVPVTFRLQ